MPANPYLPDSVLWRQKEQFSDGVGYAWIDSLKAYAESKARARSSKPRRLTWCAQVTDAEMSAAIIRFPYNTPETKEAYFYRDIFASLYPQPTCARSGSRAHNSPVRSHCRTPAQHSTVMKWVPRADWGCSSDPSGRAQKAHEQTTTANGGADDHEAKRQKLD